MGALPCTDYVAELAHMLGQFNTSRKRSLPEDSASSDDNAPAAAENEDENIAAHLLTQLLAFDDAPPTSADNIDTPLKPMSPLTEDDDDIAGHLLKQLLAFEVTPTAQFVHKKTKVIDSPTYELSQKDMLIKRLRTDWNISRNEHVAQETIVKDKLCLLTVREISAWMTSAVRKHFDDLMTRRSCALNATICFGTTWEEAQNNCRCFEEMVRCYAELYRSKKAELTKRRLLFLEEGGSLTGRVVKMDKKIAALDTLGEHNKVTAEIWLAMMDTCANFVWMLNAKRRRSVKTQVPDGRTFLSGKTKTSCERALPFVKVWRAQAKVWVKELWSRELPTGFLVQQRDCEDHAMLVVKPPVFLERAKHETFFITDSFNRLNSVFRLQWRTCN